MAKRRPITHRESKRKTSVRAQYDRVLIVCEGKKTEPRYLNDLRIDLRLTSANIQVVGAGADPLALVEAAIRCYTKDPDFEHVYCVFDRDRHERFAAAIDRLRSPPKRLKGKLKGILSYPCFEYWLLLHFENTARGYTATAGPSPCTCCIDDLKQHIEGYDKGASDAYAITKNLIEDAKARSMNRLRAAKRDGSLDPSTQVHELVAFLQQLRL